MRAPFDFVMRNHGASTCIGAEYLRPRQVQFFLRQKSAKENETRQHPAGMPKAHGVSCVWQRSFGRKKLRRTCISYLAPQNEHAALGHLAKQNPAPKHSSRSSGLPKAGAFSLTRCATASSNGGATTKLDKSALRTSSDVTPKFNSLNFNYEVA